MKRFAALAMGGLGVLVSPAGCAPRDRPVTAPPPEIDRRPILERVTDFPGEAPSNPPAALPPPAPPPPPPAQPPAENPAPPDAPPRAGTREILPGVRADIGAAVVEFDGIVPIDAHDPATPRVYLELIVCTPDTKEHEALVMTRAKAEHVHAALLAIGLEPGAPGSWVWDDRTLRPIAPRGAPVSVTLVHRDSAGRTIETPATDWVVNAETGAPFGPGEGWVFAGSRMVFRSGAQHYDADGAGTLVGLCTFGSETVAWRGLISPDSQVQEPEWIADVSKVPARGTPVTVRIRPAR